MCGGEAVRPRTPSLGFMSGLEGWCQLGASEPDFTVGERDRDREGEGERERETGRETEPQREKERERDGEREIPQCHDNK